MKPSVRSVTDSFTGNKSLLINRLNYTGECGERNSGKAVRENTYRKSYGKKRSLQSLSFCLLATEKRKARASFRQSRRGSSTTGYMYPVTCGKTANVKPDAIFDGGFSCSGTCSGVPIHVPEVHSGTGRCSTTVLLRASGKHSMLSLLHPVRCVHPSGDCSIVRAPAPDACKPTGKRASVRLPDATGHCAHALPDKLPRAGHARSQLIPHVQRQLP